MKIGIKILDADDWKETYKEFEGRHRSDILIQILRFLENDYPKWVIDFKPDESDIKEIKEELGECDEYFDLIRHNDYIY